MIGAPFFPTGVCSSSQTCESSICTIFFQNDKLWEKLKVIKKNINWQQKERNLVPSRRPVSSGIRVYFSER
jgi:hypothetical protein